MKLFFLVNIVLFNTLIFSQSVLNSRKEFYTNKNIVQNAEILRDFYLDESPDSIYSIGKRLCDEAWQREDIEMLNYGKILIASHFSKKGKIDEAKNILFHCENYFNQKRNFLRLTDVYNQIGHCFFIEKNFIKASKYYQMSLDSQKNLDLADEMFMAHLGLSECFLQMKLFDKAENEIQVFNQKVKKLQLIKGQRKAQIIMGKIDFLKQNYSDAFQHYQNAFALAYKSGDKLSLSNVHNVLAIAHFEQNNIDSAYLHFNKALKYRIEMNYPIPLIESYENMGEYFVFMNNIKTAETFFMKALKVAKKHQFYLSKMEIYQRLLELSNQTTLVNLSKNEIQDSLFSLYQYKLHQENKKERDLDSIHNSLKTEDLKLFYQKREKELNERLTKSKEMNFITLIVFSLMFVFLLGFLLYTKYNFKRPD
ncbi:MAG: tetratricopeptide repeat protein [Flavobacteriia bacterium]|nr:tetratricopeptide repeat protein [Flavobacteriia bacterium]